LFVAIMLAIAPAFAEIHTQSFVPLYGMTDVAIQHAIDAAFAAGDDLVICDAGVYTAANPIYQDPPNNMRTSGVANPTQFSFSLRVVGGQGPSGYTFNDKVVWWIGTGRNMVLDGVLLTAPMPSGFVAYRNQVLVKHDIVAIDDGDLFDRWAHQFDYAATWGLTIELVRRLHADNDNLRAEIEALRWSIGR
jgi:hypothetical protein